MKPDNRNEIKRKLKDFKKDTTTQVKKQIIKLRDTRGNFSMAIKLPTKDYSPKTNQKPLTKSEINERYNLRHPDRNKESKRKWRLNNKDYYRKYRHLHKERINKKRMEYYYRDKLARKVNS